MNSTTDAEAISALARAGAWLRRHDNWTPEQCAAALADPAVRVLDMPVVERLAMACWTHRETESPGRLGAPGPWWVWVGIGSPQRRKEAAALREPPAVNHAAQIREQLAEQARRRAQEAGS